MIYGLGFTFNNIHSSKFNVVSKSDDRTLLPAKRKNEFVIPGRDGTVDFSDNTYEKRIITLNIFIISKNLIELREKARSVAKWLSGDGLLLFDDEKDKAYKAKVYSPTPLSQLIHFGECAVSFECSPFAESPLYNQETVNIIKNKYETKVVNKGTVNTPCIISIKNTGTTDIKNIKLTRKAGV